MNDAQLNIAVCDDEAYMREMLCKELERQFAKRKINIHITEYDAGEGLLEADSLFDIIFLDIEMPEMDGFETCKTLKQNPDLESVPVIFMTGLDSENNVESSFNSGAVDYIQKPIRIPARMCARICFFYHSIDPLIVPLFRNGHTDKVLNQLHRMKHRTQTPFIESRDHNSHLL